MINFFALNFKLLLQNAISKYIIKTTLLETLKKTLILKIYKIF